VAPAQLPALLNGGGPRQRRCAAGFARAAPRAAPRAAAGVPQQALTLLLAQKSGRLAQRSSAGKKSVSKVGIDPTTFAWREENPKGLGRPSFVEFFSIKYESDALPNLQDKAVERRWLAADQPQDVIAKCTDCKLTSYSDSDAGIEPSSINETRRICYNI
jgi:hypothetical protein